MRLKTLALSLMLTMLALPALAETFRTPEALLKSLYAFSRHASDNADPDAPSLYSAYFSDRLNALMQADRDRTPEGEIGALDFDPVISGQDGEATNLVVGQPIVIDDTAEVEVEFTNFEPVTLYYTLVREHGGWKVNDIAQQKGEYPWSLGEIFGGQ